jgi:orotate phosphoribosyltransferase
LLPEQKVALINIYKGEENNYWESAINAIRAEGGSLTSMTTGYNIEGIKPINIENKRVLVIEDLISTGGSSAKEVDAARNLGATADQLISIFTYNLDEAKGQFDKLVPKCDTYSILPYEILLEEAVNTGRLNKDDEALLKEWRSDPFNWGEKHGFPKVEKK